MFYKQQNTYDKEKGLLAGIVVGSALTLLLTSKKLRNHLQGKPLDEDRLSKDQKRSIKELKSGIQDTADKLHNTAADVKSKVTDKIKS